MPEPSSTVGPRIATLAQRLHEVDALRPPAMPASDADGGRSEIVRLRNPDGGEIVETIVLHSRETLVRAADMAYAVIGDSNGDENYSIWIHTATRSGARLVHQESPISPRVYPFGTGLLWIRRDAARRPHQALWWDHDRDAPAVLFDEPDRTHRLELRSVDDGTAVLASRGPDATDHWIINSRDGDTPTCRPLASDLPDMDAIAWRGDIIILDRGQGRVQADRIEPLDAVAPAEFIAEHLQAAGDALAVIGRRRGRQAVWMPAQGPTAVWTAPPAGTMLPSFDPDTGRPIFLVSSPLHEPQVVHPSAVGDVHATSTGRADVHCITTNSDDGTPIPITLLLPPGSEPHPLVVNVYGAYGISLEGPFDPFTDDLLARGVAVAYCHVRGGGENGSEWHRQARGVGRYRSIEDLLACLALLRDLPAIAADHIVLSAASAGGLTAAAACLREPTWLRGLHLVHPFVDPLTALMNPDSNLATTDWAEFGDPRGDAQVRDRLEHLSPMTIVRQLALHSCPLPRAWIRAAHHDARVDSAAVERFSHLYRTASTSTDLAHVVYRVAAGGHLGGQSATQAHEENLLAHAWLLDLLDAPLSRAA